MLISFCALILLFDLLVLSLRWHTYLQQVPLLHRSHGSILWLLLWALTRYDNESRRTSSEITCGRLRTFCIAIFDVGDGKEYL
jgi:hypothetical protein